MIGKICFLWFCNISYTFLQVVIYLLYWTLVSSKNSELFLFVRGFWHALLVCDSFLFTLKNCKFYVLKSTIIHNDRIKYYVQIYKYLLTHGWSTSRSRLCKLLIFSTCDLDTYMVFAIFSMKYFKSIVDILFIDNNDN